MTKYFTSLDQETLVAYIDNELSAETAAMVEKALASDQEALKKVRLMKLGGAAAAHAFDQALEEPLPSRLLAATLRHRRSPFWMRVRRGRGLRWRLTLAACLASLAIGFAGGLLIHGADRGFAPAAARGQDALSTSFESALFVALDAGAPGQSYDYGSDAMGRGRIMLGKSFVTGFGSDCREFDRVETRGSVQSHDGGLACRDHAGSWTVMTIAR